MLIVRHLGAVAALLCGLAGNTAYGQEVWRATRTLVPGDVVRGEDVIPEAPSGHVVDTIASGNDIVGLEVRRRVYSGRELATRDVGPRLAVKASTNVTVLWKSGDLSLELEGRALEAGAVGDEIRVLNPQSLRTIRGTVTGDGTVEVKSEP